MNAAQTAVKSTFLASAIRKCGGNEEKGALLYSAYGSSGQVCCVFLETLDNFNRHAFYHGFLEKKSMRSSVITCALHVMLKLNSNSGAFLISNLGGQMPMNQIQKGEFPYGIKLVSRK